MVSTISLHQLRDEGHNKSMFVFAISVKPSNTTKVESTIQLAKKYHHYTDVFNKVNASTLRHHRPYGCPINLQPGKEPPWDQSTTCHQQSLKFFEPTSRKIWQTSSFHIRNLQLVHPFSSSRKKMAHFV